MPLLFWLSFRSAAEESASSVAFAVASFSPVPHHHLAKWPAHSKGHGFSRAIPAHKASGLQPRGMLVCDSGRTQCTENQATVIVRMEMDSPNASGLFGDIAVSYGLPALFFVMFAANRSFASRVRTKREGVERRLRRIAIAFALLLFLAMFIALMLQDRPTLSYLFRNSPLLFSLISLLLVSATIALIATLFYSQLRPSLWKSDFRIESHSLDSAL